MLLRRTRYPGSVRARLAGVCVAAALVASAGCSDGPPGGARNSRAEVARAEAEKLAMNAVKESGKVAGRVDPKAVPPAGLARRVEEAAKTVPVVHQDALAAAAPAPPPPPAARPQPAVANRSAPAEPAVIRERVASRIPFPTEAEAEEDAITRAREVLHEKLNALSPPITRTPSASAVRAQHVVKDSRKVRSPGEDERELLTRSGLGADRVYVEFEVKVTEAQVRELRSQDRVVSALRVTGLFTAVALALFLFLRLDEWSRGYLTSWLGAGAAFLVAAVVAVAFLVG